MPEPRSRDGIDGEVGSRGVPEVSDWDREAAHFDEAADHGLSDPVTRGAWRAVLLEHLPSPPARVADLGCGTGSLSVLLAQDGFEVRGVDSSRAMLDRGRAKADAAGVTVGFAVADAARPPLAEGSVDVVLCRHVLWALPEPADVLRCWTRLLTPGGRLILIEGRWHTGAGLSAAACVRLLVDAGRRPTLHRLTAPALWGAAITDERYLVVA